MKCRCGHGRQWHRRAAQVSGWLRARGKRPVWLPCQFQSYATVDKCRCRNWHPEEIA